MTKQTIIGDSSPLIALAIIEQLELLAKLYSQVIIPEKVWEEITVHGAGLAGAAAIKQLDWLIIEKPASELVQPLSTGQSRLNYLDVNNYQIINVLQIGLCQNSWFFAKNGKNDICNTLIIND